MSARARPHQRFRARVQLSSESVRRFALEAGDENPVHTDAEYSRGTRFGRPIASGTHTSSLLMGLTATHFSEGGAMLGLEFSFRFRRPVYADESVELEWLVTAVRPSAQLGGELVDLVGRLRNAAGQTAVGARGRVLLVAAL